MSKTITLTLAGTPTPVNPNQGFSGYRFQLFLRRDDGSLSEPAEVVGQQTSAAFQDAAPGTYVAKAAALSANGNVLGEEVSAELVVNPEGTATYIQPTGLSYTVA